MPEGDIEKRREILQGDVVKLGRERGFSDGNFQKLYGKWIQQEQSKVDSPRARVRFEISCGEVYRDMDMPTEALQCFEDAAYQARQEELEDLVQSIEAAFAVLDRAI